MLIIIIIISPRRARPPSHPSPLLFHRYAPLFCVLLALIEAGPAPFSAAAAPLALLFCAGRASHAASMAFDADFPWRVRGTGCTLLAFLGGAGVLVARTGLGLVAAARA